MKHYLPNSIFISKGMRMMFIRLAETKDTDDWRIVAENVASIFGHPTMAKDPAFIEYMQNKYRTKGRHNRGGCPNWYMYWVYRDFLSL
jgi:hypothetical protein